MKKKNVLKIFHLPDDMGMRAYSLSRSEKVLSLDSQMIVRRRGVHDSAWVKPLQSSNKLVFFWKLLKAFISTLKADVIMANNGASLLDFSRFHLDLLDIRIYKFLGKKIIVTYQGCDVRMCRDCPIRDSLSSNEKCVNCPPQYSYADFDRIKRRRLNIWLRYADAVLGITPDLCRVEGVKYTPHAKLVQQNLKKNKKKDGKIFIAHPPKPQIKGTDKIEEEICKLVKEYPNTVEYVSISGLSWKECQKVLSDCDIVVDQILYGWYGGISVEAALLGTLPIAYIDSDLLRFIPENMRNNLPVYSIFNKDELFGTLRRLIKDRELLARETLRCHKSAMKFHEGKAVSKFLIKEYYE
ncbi:hypothetical protein GF312_09845 [Candidatus Poribacteria bacterium]|nr:hypothetical protein [Candidatus Poribacteria bacterium]